MAGERDALGLRTQVGQYWIHDVEYFGTDTIVYRAEDMRLNREVWLHEYFPEGMARRHLKEDGSSTVYVHPTQSEAFAAGKARQQAIYDTLKGVEHPALPALVEQFESGGTFYAVTHYRSDTITFRRLYNTGKSFSEKQIVSFATSLVTALTLLQRRQLQLRLLTPDTLLMDTATKEGIVAYAEYVPLEAEGVQKTIYELGVLLHGIMQGSYSMDAKAPEPLEPSSDYSEALCTLVNRMVSGDVSQRPKSYEELQNLFHSLVSDETAYEAPVHETGSSIFSTLARTASIAVILLFAYYVFNQPERVKAEELTQFDAVRFHLVAYFGNAEAQRALGQMYEKGYGVERDIKKAVKWYTKAAEQGNLYAQQSLGILYQSGTVDKNSGRKALLWLEEAAKQGNAASQYRLGRMYDRDDSSPTEFKLAAKWYSRAAEQGHAFAQNNLARLYTMGYGVEQSDEKARVWYTKAAEQGDGYAQLSLGRMWRDGSGGSVDYAKARYWTEKSVAQGNIRATYMLGLLYLDGQGVEKDYEKAITCFGKGTAVGDAYAEMAMGYMYSLGYGVPQDYQEAREWYLKAARKGQKTAQYNLAKLYELGRGGATDIKAARYWYGKAAAQGDQIARKNLETL